MIMHVPRASNEIANILAQNVSSYKLIPAENTKSPWGDSMVTTISQQSRASTNLGQEVIQYLANLLTQIDYKLK